ncbi:MAG: glycosyltransferase [Phycisphaeraceae bacterium]|nr:glycosyltransferase [Phycisphaeraceae bacterium]
MTEPSALTLCVACPERGGETETFIDHHLQRLPMRLCPLFGWRPKFDAAGRDIYGDGLSGRMGRWMSRTLQGRTWPDIRRRSLIRFYRRNHIDAVLAEYGPIGAELADSCEAAGLPLVVCFRGFDVYRRDILKKNEQAYRRLFDQAAALVAVSGAIRDQLIRLGAPDSKISVIPSGVDTDVFAGARPESSEPLFLAVGRLVEKKAPLHTLGAFEQVARELPEARLVIIGDGPLMPAVRDRLETMACRNQVTLMGARPHHVVLEQMKRARALVQHSVVAPDGDSEGTPNSVVEAQSCGLPVVATRHMGIRDVVIEGKTGYLVDEFDMVAMAENMIVLGRDPDLAARLGTEGRQHVVEHFALQQSISRLVELIRRSMSCPRGVRA